MRVIGIDPGSAVTGFGIVDGQAGRFHHVAAGTIRAGRLAAGPNRLLNIYRRLREVIDLYTPEAMSLERSFAAVNIQSAFRLGEARAVAMLAAADRELALFEYTPTEVKIAIAGFGHADKAQVKSMVRRTLGIDGSIELADDAADALALAACHLMRGRLATATRLAGAMRESPGNRG